MATTTTSILGLTLATPGTNEPYSIARNNSNLSKIDAEAGSLRTRATGVETRATALETWRTADEPKIDGLYDGISLGTEDLDALVKTAMYAQQTGANATLARNYPQAGLPGTLMVYAASNSLTQTYYSRAGSNDNRSYYRTKFSTGAWTAWVEVPMVAQTPQLLIPASATNATVASNGTVTFNGATFLVDNVFKGGFSVYRVVMFATGGSSATMAMQLRTTAPATLSSALYDKTDLFGRSATTGSSTVVAQTDYNLVNTAAAVQILDLTVVGVTSGSRFTATGHVSHHALTPSSSNANLASSVMLTYRDSAASIGGLRFDFGGVSKSGTFLCYGIG